MGAATLSSAVAVTVIIAAVSPGLDAAQDFAMLRQRWLNLLTGGPPAGQSDPAIQNCVDALARQVASNGSSRDPVAGTGYWDKLNTAPGRTFLWQDIGRLARGPQFWVDSLKRLERLALAAKTPGSPFYKNRELVADVISAVDWITSEYYHPDKVVRKGTSDWWQLEIGVPLFLAPICIELQDELPKPVRDRCVAAMDAFNPDPARLCVGTSAEKPATGSAIVNKNRGHIAVGLLREDPSYLERASKNLERLFTDTTSGDGFYPDGSFIMHRVFPYNGGYGIALLYGLADYGVILAGTPWAFDEQQSARLRTWFEKGVLPFLWHGRLMSMVRGREIARWDSGESRAGSMAAVSLLRATRAVQPADAAALLTSAARVLRESPRTLLDFDRTTPFDLLLVKNLSAAENGPLTGFFAYPSMDRAVHRTGEWAAGLALHSSRTASAESINGENRRGWHTGSGMLFLYNTDPASFEEGYWATVDANRLPGTTVESGLATGYERGRSPLVGSLAAPSARDSSPAGLATFTLPSAKSRLEGRKTWFFLPNAVIQLLAGLNGNSDAVVETIIENRKLRREGPQAFLVDGHDAAARSEGIEPLPVSQARWAWIADVAPDGRGMGIAFFSPTSFLTRRECRTDSWKSVNTGSTYKTPDTRVTERFQTLWLDHGVRPAGASAAFAVLPNATAAQTAEFAKQPPVVILANTPDVQAIHCGSLTAAAFGSSGGEVGKHETRLSASGPALVAVSSEDATFAVTACDPTQTAAGELVIEFGIPLGRILEKDPAITVLQDRPTLRLAIKLDDLAGRGVALRAAH